MKNILVGILAAVALSGCLVGDKLHDLNAKYCAETNEEKREMLIDVIQAKFPMYPRGGLCKVEERF